MNGKTTFVIHLPSQLYSWPSMISFIHVIRSIFISKKTLEEQAGHSPILTRSCICHHQTCLLDGEIKQSNKINTKSGKLIKMIEKFITLTELQALASQLPSVSFSLIINYREPKYDRKMLVSMKKCKHWYLFWRKCLKRLANNWNRITNTRRKWGRYCILHCGPE